MTQHVTELRSAGTPGSSASSDTRVVGSLLVRPVALRDGNSLHALLRSALPGVIADRERWLKRWRWSCWDNLFRGDRPAGWVLEDDEEIVGHLGAVYVPLRVRGRRRLGQIGTDYAIAPAATVRGGAFAGLALAEVFFDQTGNAIPLATTANEKTAAVFGRFGCQPIAWTREFWRVRTTLDAQLRACYGGVSRLWRHALSGTPGRALGGSLVRIMTALQRGPTIPLPQACTLEITNPTLAGDLSKLSGPGDFAFDRSSRYLQWRHARQPEHHNCRVLVLRKRNRGPIAAAYLFVDDASDPPVAWIEDVLLPTNSLELLRTLLCAAQRMAASAGADYLFCTTGNPCYRPLFWQLGWESRARNAPGLLIGGSVELPSMASPFSFWHGVMF